ncbi:TetR/AcrR family transcriptional regulator [Flavobacterium sp. ACN6]|uniref:TetR/AcrR family transcriptional regulator n=1 Tax=Flavobacterium sp. ACN6 TaxID=1920426 RepID=UPI000BB3B13A|nr:TetR/AcrR family transcriptional regulator [Flavobacterium sp. ACN6]PBJ07991.1 hypothetical protein BSF42_37080 [Flavobacterium sp. ACN6]
MKAEKTIRTYMEETRQQKIIAAAKFFFTLKDYSSYKTWDISSYNETNPSLVNYYFHNKTRIFNKVIFQNVMVLFNTLHEVLDDRKKTAVEKIEFLVLEYTHLLLEKPDFAIFLLNEIVSESDKIDVLVIMKEKLFNSCFQLQLLELRKSRLNNFNPGQMLLNLIGMVLLPIVSTAFHSHSAVVVNRQFYTMIGERKKLLPLWISSMVQ